MLTSEQRRIVTQHAVRFAESVDVLLGGAVCATVASVVGPRASADLGAEAFAALVRETNAIYLAAQMGQLGTPPATP